MPQLLDTWQPDGFEMRRFAPDETESVPPYRPFPARPLQSGSVFLRRFRPPIAIRVTVERGRPVRVAIDRRGMPGGIVEQSAGPWRTSGAWWSEVPSRWDRDEWDVAFSDGSVCRVFRERGSGTGSWMLSWISPRVAPARSAVVTAKAEARRARTSSERQRASHAPGARRRPSTSLRAW